MSGRYLFCATPASTSVVCYISCTHTHIRMSVTDLELWSLSRGSEVTSAYPTWRPPSTANTLLPTSSTTSELKMTPPPPYTSPTGVCSRRRSRHQRCVAEITCWFGDVVTMVRADMNGPEAIQNSVFLHFEGPLRPPIIWLSLHCCDTNSAQSGMDDDTDIDRPFPLTAFALGSTRNGGEQGIPGEVRFLRGFGSSVHKGPNSRLNFNLDRQWIYIKAAPTNVSSTPPALLPLEAEVPFEVSHHR